MAHLESALAQLDKSWEIVEGKKLTKTFEFKGFLKTMSFVNAVAWEANRVMHHPDMEVSFSRCVIHITTHDEGNVLTEKDVELAQRIDALF
jgi:4a-hydroxytetrahydrobiopterin dehydratase